ncbi:flagellar protein FlaG [Paludibacterium yongneupense]|uniref:flagellar protein FlaG n=1 Tax=Paludibacterium yongneupense TaxID=400061 RepID=UPI0006867897|nr:flagellar protein FlaG [Paludibacterium yongneupense]
MQIPPLQSLSNNAGVVSLQRQQVELVQPQGDAGSTIVLPGSAQAVSAVSQSQGDNAANSSTTPGNGSIQANDALLSTISAQAQQIGNAKPSKRDVQDAIDQLNKAATLYDSQLQFSVDKDTDIQVIKVIDKQSQKIIRQIPSEDIVRIAKAIDDFKGMLLKDQA